jgi:hypothetical protein
MHRPYPLSLTPPFSSRHLLTESKSRKVIIVENALFPNPIKQLISEVLFDNLKVPSVSFTSGHMLTLMATGNTTGLVVDFGFHETTVVPVSLFRLYFESLLTRFKIRYTNLVFSTHILRLLQLQAKRFCSVFEV